MAHGPLRKAAAPSGARSYYPSWCRKQRTPTCASLKDSTEQGESSLTLTESEAALIEAIPSPTRSRARMAALRETTPLASDSPSAQDLESVSSASNLREGSRDSRHLRSRSVPSVENAPVAQPTRSQTPPAVVRELPHPQRNCILPWRLQNIAGWEVDMSELKLRDRIGAGTTAEVFRASWHGTDVAVKQLRAPLPSEFQRELSVLLQFRHPHLVLFMGVSTAGCPKIVSELCDGGTVFALLHERQELSILWSQRLKVAVDTAKGMNFLHRQRVIHRDLKSLNLLLAARVESTSDIPWTKISDFGLSRYMPLAPSGSLGSTGCMMTGGVGTPFWIAPEVIRGEIYDEKADVYSFGIVLYELICRRIPYDGSGLEPLSIAFAVTNGRRPDCSYVPKGCPVHLRRSMHCCWAPSPRDRPSFDGALELLKRAQNSQEH
mmetsp:Transcript_132705/g.233805  ORF Transcript_132705/g.233805 Transcript_132705/m.233805 type:complete len:435 (-) Transcript_132705:71-1375(-)